MFTQQKQHGKGTKLELDLILLLGSRVLNVCALLGFLNLRVRREILLLHQQDCHLPKLQQPLQGQRLIINMVRLNHSKS